MRGKVPGRGGGLEEVEERMAGLEQISESISSRFRAHLDTEHVDVSQFGLGAAEHITQNAEQQKTANKPEVLGAKKTETTETALKAIRLLAKTKDTTSVRHCTDTVHRSLVFGNSDARSVSCSDEAVHALVQLVAARLPVFEYTDIYNAAQIMSARDVDRAKVQDRAHIMSGCACTLAMSTPVRGSHTLHTHTHTYIYVYVLWWQVLSMQLRYGGVPVLGEVVKRGAVALSRAEKGGATGALLGFFSSTYAALSSSHERNTPSAALAPTVLSHVLQVLCKMAASRSAAMSMSNNDGFIRSILELCRLKTGLQEAAAALVAVLVSFQQCRAALIAHNAYEALGIVCLAQSPDIECKARCMTAMCFLLEDLVHGRAAVQGEGDILRLCLDSAVSVLRQCEPVWTDSGNTMLAPAINVTQVACMCIRTAVERCVASDTPVDVKIGHELEEWVLWLQQRVLQKSSALYFSDSESQAKRQILQTLESCLAVVLNAHTAKGALDSTRSSHISSRLRSILQLTSILDKTSHAPHTACDGQHEGTTCAAARLAAALELARWADMPGGIDALVRAHTKLAASPSLGVTAVCLKCLRLSSTHASAPSLQWQTCAQLVARLVSTDVASAQFAREDGVTLVMKLWEHPHDLVKGCVLDILTNLAAMTKGKMMVSKAPGVREVMLRGLQLQPHQEKSIFLLSSCWQPGSVLPSMSSWQAVELARVSAAVLQCVSRGSAHVMGRAAMLLANLLGAPSTFVSTHHACLASFVTDLCEAMRVCTREDEVALFTRVLACASASATGKGVLEAVRDTVCNSVERAAAACTDARIIDHALVLARNTGAPELECMSLRARHLVRQVRGATSNAPSRSLRLLCHLIAGPQAARLAVLAVNGEQVLLNFLCSPCHADSANDASSSVTSLKHSIHSRQGDTQYAGHAQTGDARYVEGNLARNEVVTALLTAITRRLLDTHAPLLEAHLPAGPTNSHAAAAAAATSAAHAASAPRATLAAHTPTPSPLTHTTRHPLPQGVSSAGSSFDLEASAMGKLSGGEGGGRGGGVGVSRRDRRAVDDVVAGPHGVAKLVAQFAGGHARGLLPRYFWGVAVYCSVVQCSAMCCSVVQCSAVWCCVVHCIACVGPLAATPMVCCSVLQCVAVCFSVSQCVELCCIFGIHGASCCGICSVLQCVAVCCSVCCSVLQCAAVHCSVLQCAACIHIYTERHSQGLMPLYCSCTILISCKYVRVCICIM